MASQTLQSDKEIIAAIGGVEALVAAGYSSHAVKKWLQRGIPWKDRAKVREMAAAKRKRLPESFLTERAEIVKEPKRKKAA